MTHAIASRKSRCCCWTTLFAGVSAALCAAHDGDPKLLDQLPRYEGPGYRGGDAGLPRASFPASNVQLLAWLPLGEFGLNPGSGATVEGYVSPAGVEYAVFGHRAGTALVRLSDPSNPVIVGEVPGPVGLWRDVRVWRDYAYSVSEDGQGVQVISLANLENGGPVLVNTILTGGNPDTHTVFLNKDSGYLYRCGGAGTGGVRVYNLNVDPATPVYIGSFGTEYTHECQVVTYASGPYAGKEIAFTCDGSSVNRLKIYDVTNKAQPQLLAQTTYPNASYAHQSWISEDYKWLYLNDETDSLPQTRVFNIENLSAPVFAGAFSIGSTSIDHNLYVKGDLLFESNYRSGLRVFDRSADPVQPTQIAWFDTFPENDNQSFNGVWDNYPYLPSGIVLGSDMEKGLFVWWVGAPLLQFIYPDGLPQFASASDSTSVKVQINGQSGGSLVPGSARLHWDAGNGFEQFPVDEVEPGVFVGQLPPVECARNVRYFFSAQSTNGMTWRDPPAASGAAHAAISATAESTLAAYDMESLAGWSAGAPGDSATAGLWTRVDPVGTLAQPENDHSPVGALCWVTAQGGVPPTTADVDGGKTTLVSPPWNLAAASHPVIGYWRWYSNDVPGEGAVNDDPFFVEISGDGANWLRVETIAPGSDDARGGWRYHALRVEDYITPTAQVRLRFIAQDANAPSIVEAAIDDVAVRSIFCDSACDFDLTGDGVVDQADLAVLLASYESNAGGDLDGNGVTNQADLALLLGVYGQACP